MGPTAVLRAKETRKENGIEIYINKTDQATKYVRPVLFHSLPTKTSLPTKRKFCRSYQHQNKDYKTNHYLSGSNLEKQNVIDLSFPLHPTPRERIVIMFLYPLPSNVPSIRRKKIIMFLHFSGPSP